MGVRLSGHRCCSLPNSTNARQHRRLLFLFFGKFPSPPPSTTHPFPSLPFLPSAHIQNTNSNSNSNTHTQQSTTSCTLTHTYSPTHQQSAARWHHANPSGTRYRHTFVNALVMALYCKQIGFVKDRDSKLSRSFTEMFTNESSEGQRWWLREGRPPPLTVVWRLGWWGWGFDTATPKRDWCVAIELLIPNC